ncbi:UxaA family hydrolase [Cetobacterium sp. 2G large]|uniref:UxaA family hydrolase n=1 Tax=Cetobacterium sp. 2G large TaxID=2759680 RepID=UPI00163CB6FA|nr:altronate dehydratase family protein [Cetobacterium sp. 2G large]MBC2854742.1 altronate dehydratase [Cetobacterium sp. 2G large]
MKKCIRINKKDNVAVALLPINKGEIVEVEDLKIKLKEDIKKGHKFTLELLGKNKDVIKYGMPIGHTLKDVEAGQWIHTHNLKTNLNDLDTYSYGDLEGVDLEGAKRKKVNVYLRKNNKIGIRNELWIIPTVGCVNGIGENIIEEFKKRFDISKVDGLNVFKHNYGCSQLGKDHITTRTTLQNIVTHPNAGGVLVLGLGCENNQVKEFKETLGEFDKERVRFLIAQDSEDEIEEGVELLKELYDKVISESRVEKEFGDLVVGLECGGSDGFSGITANPLVGEFSDYIVEHDGTTILTEVPEMFGAETLLMKRCINKDIFNKTVDMVNDFKKYFISYNQSIYENPSPGNKEGGISTLEDKSLGCTQKSGISKVKDVLRYGEVVKSKGLVLLEAPGNDLVATTALGAAGAHIVLFTTGRGTPYGGFVPTIKISTNTELAKKKPKWIDFDAGKLLDSNVTMKELLGEFVDYIIEVVEGRKTNNEINNFKEIAILKNGVTL